MSPEQNHLKREKKVKKYYSKIEYWN